MAGHQEPQHNPTQASGFAYAVAAANGNAGVAVDIIKGVNLPCLRLGTKDRPNEHHRVVVKRLKKVG